MAAGMSALAGRPKREHRTPGWLARSYDDLTSFGSGHEATEALLRQYQTFTFRRDTALSEGCARMPVLETADSFVCRSVAPKRKALEEDFATSPLEFSHPAAKLAERSWSSSSEDTDGAFAGDADTHRPAKRFRQYCADNPFAAQAAAASLLAGAAWIEAVQALAAAKLHSGISAAKKSSSQHRA